MTKSLQDYLKERFKKFELDVRTSKVISREISDEKILEIFWITGQKLTQKVAGFIESAVVNYHSEQNQPYLPTDQHKDSLMFRVNGSMRGTCLEEAQNGIKITYFEKAKH